MIDFLQKMEENTEKLCDRRLFADGSGTTFTYGEFYQLTGRVYAYLRQQGIGREDFVLVCLPRGPLPLVASCGVLRAGAAFVIVEDTMPAERIAYIRADCGCKLMIDAECWQTILATEPLSGYEERDAHSAALAVYTSGTTGAPKGVVHEYGNIARMIAASPLPDGPAVSRFALCSPLNFVLSAMCELVLVYTGTTLIYVVPFAILKDPMQLRAYLVENQITFAFLSPLFVKKMAPILSSLAFCVVGAEPAVDLFSPDFAILNGYTMSEVAFTIASFLIDQPYANTPVGRPAFECPIRLVGEGGQDVPTGEKGEIVVENPYVRGYINLPEKTAAAFVDGWYHTGDLGKWDEQGNLVVCGRIDDMAKINGNRVEPGEIEIAAREVLGLRWAAAKVFKDGERAFTCLYYLEDIEIDAEQARAKMAERLPHYMLPSFFIHIDEVPLTPAGKFNRRALQAPVLDEERVAYRAPENDTQRALCAAFAKVFGLATVGIGDEFARLGGDSVNAMEIVVASELDGLSVADILQGQTPEGIAALYLSRASGEDPDEINARAFETDHPLTADQAYTVGLQLSEPTSTMRGIQYLMKFDKDVIDLTRLASAITAAVRNHPALLTELYRTEEGEIRQRFSRDMMGDVEVEHMTEAEFAQVKESLVQPFAMIGGPLCRFHVFETESAGYVFADLHHAVFDGASRDILFGDVMAAYRGAPLSQDYYPYLLDMLERQGGAAMCADEESYFEKKYAGVDWCRHLSAAGEARDSAVGVVTTPIPVTTAGLGQMEKSRGVTKNGLFALAASIALSLSADAPDVMLFWSFNGRTDAKELSTVGALRSYLPIAFSFESAMTMGDLCASVNEQISEGIAHCREPYLERHASLLDEGVTRVLYQGSLGGAPQMPGLLGAESLRQSVQVSRSFVNCEIQERGDGVVLMTRYTASCFTADQIDAFVKLFNAAAEVLVAHADEADAVFDTLSREISDHVL